MVTRGSFTLPSCDGVHQLFVRQWIPEEAPKGVIQLSHGIAEHTGRYDEYATFLAEAGYYVVGADHLGHGLTAIGPEELGYTAEKAGWLKLCADLERVHQHTKSSYPQVPYILLGHSMGSFLARTFLIRYPGQVDGCILSGTGQENGAILTLGADLAHLTAKKIGSRGKSPFLQKLMFGSYNRGFDPAEGENAWICSVPQVARDYEADPLSGGQASCRLVEDMLWGLRYIWKRENLEQMDRSTPILLYSGDQDPVGGRGKQVEKVYRRFVDLGCENVTLTLYPGGRHEMHNEENRREVFQDVLNWLDENYFQ